MITKLSEACRQYNVQELCDLFDHARSSYYYQSKGRSITDSTKSVIKSMKQISIDSIQYPPLRGRLDMLMATEGLNYS
jgi:hypothetical protein